MPTTLILIAVALLPVAILLFYILRKDRKSPEPAGQLVKGFVFGILSVPLSFTMSVPFSLIGLYPDEAAGIIDSIRLSFFGAAIPEEAAKLFMLWLLVRRNRYFDEKMDGIVYAVCVSLGFAGAENLVADPDPFLKGEVVYGNFMSVGISRALFAIPGHFGFGVLMGYYYSMSVFYPKSPVRNKIMVILAPVLAHGIYDSILFIMDVTSPAVSGILFMIFLIICVKIWGLASRSIREHIARDNDRSA